MRTGTQRGAIAAAPYVFTVVFFALWEAACRLFKIPVFFLPAPSVIAERQVEFARPRDLDITYTGEFTDLVHDLRSQIAGARQAS